MMLAEALIAKYGYWAVLIGSFVESETIILTASALAKRGVLDIYKIFFVIFAGTVFADQVLYYLGRYMGVEWIYKWPKMKNAAKVGIYYLNKHQAKYIFAFRFIWGIRIASPIVIGAFGVPIWKYTVLNFFAGLLWSGVSCIFGYYVGGGVLDLMISIFSNINFSFFVNLLYAFLLLAVFAAAFFLKKLFKL